MNLVIKVGDSLGVGNRQTWDAEWDDLTLVLHYGTLRHYKPGNLYVNLGQATKDEEWILACSVQMKEAVKEGRRKDMQLAPLLHSTPLRYSVQSLR